MLFNSKPLVAGPIIFKCYYLFITSSFIANQIQLYVIFLSTTPSECYIHLQLHVLFISFHLLVYAIKKATYVGIMMLYLLL